MIIQVLVLFSTLLCIVGASQRPVLPVYPDDADPSLYGRPWPKAPLRREPLPGLNARKYSEITFIGAHNSEALRTPDNDWSLFGNQYFDLTTQLNSGVRLIQAQGHPDPEGTSTIRLCHSFCIFMDGGSLDGYLLDAKAWLDRNPREVLTFVWVNVGVPLEDWVRAYYNTGFDMISYAPPQDLQGAMGIDDWPTIEEMLECGKRAVTFMSNGADEDRIPWLLSEFDYMFETDFDNEDPGDFDCEVDRPHWPHGVVPDRLSLVNHFLYAKVGFGFVYPNATYANHTNGPGFREGELGEHAVRCRERYERRPNFFLVDFFNEGDVWAAEHGMNLY